MTNDPFPTNIAAEQALLAGLIVGPVLPSDIDVQDVDECWFADPIHAAIYHAIRAQAAAGLPHDAETLSSILAPSAPTATPQPTSMLEEVGGARYLAELAAYHAPNVALAVFEIREAWISRQLIESCRLAISLAKLGLGSTALHSVNRDLQRLFLTPRCGSRLDVTDNNKVVDFHPAARGTARGSDDWRAHVMQDGLFAILNDARDLEHARHLAAEAIAAATEGDAA